MGEGKFEGRKDYQIDIKEGNTILIKRGSGDPVKDFDLSESSNPREDTITLVDGEYRIVIYDEIIGVF